MVRNDKSNDKIKDALGEVIQSGRAQMGLSREKLAELVDLSLRYIVSIENESKKPAFDKLYKLIRTLGVDANAIFYPENKANNAPAERVTRLLMQCEEHEIMAVAAMVETLLNEKTKQGK